MILHVVQVEDLVDQHQTTNDVPKRCALSRVGDAGMVYAGCVKPQKIIVLRDKAQRFRIIATLSR